jgi:hypothetical protein
MSHSLKLRVQYHPGCGSTIQQLHPIQSNPCVPTPCMSQSSFYCHKLHLELPMHSIHIMSSHFCKLLCYLQFTTEFLTEIPSLLLNNCHDALHLSVYNLSFFLQTRSDHTWWCSSCFPLYLEWHYFNAYLQRHLRLFSILTRPTLMSGLTFVLWLFVMFDPFLNVASGISCNEHQSLKCGFWFEIQIYSDRYCYK